MASRLICRLLASVALHELGFASVHCLVAVGTIFVSSELFVSFLKTLCEEHQGNNRKPRERISGHTCPLLVGVLRKLGGRLWCIQADNMIK